MEELLIILNKEYPFTYYLLSGASPRNVNHVVVGKGGVIIHDPHPSNSGLIGPCINSKDYLVEILNLKEPVLPIDRNVGKFIDSIAGKKRTPAAVAGRLLEETVELALAAGLSTGDIMNHIVDSLHNQSLKVTSRSTCTVFPSELSIPMDELASECADVCLVLKDFCYVSNVDLELEESKKWNNFIKKKFRVAINGTIYAVKPHIK